MKQRVDDGRAKRLRELALLSDKTSDGPGDWFEPEDLIAPCSSTSSTIAPTC